MQYIVAITGHFHYFDFQVIALYQSHELTSTAAIECIDNNCLSLRLVCSFSNTQTLKPFKFLRVIVQNEFYIIYQPPDTYKIQETLMRNIVIYIYTQTKIKQL